MPRAWLLSVLLLTACGDDHRVPFGQGGEGDRTREEDEPPPPAFRPLEGRSLPPGTPEVAIEGAPLRVEGELRGVLPLDLDGDGDRDAIALAATPEAVTVVHGRREADRFEPRPVASLPSEGCAVAQTRLVTPTPTHVLAEATLRCDGGEEWTASWLLSREAPPRVLETLSRRGGTFAFSFQDLDEDGHTDVLATTSIGDSPLELRFLDRPSGLARAQDQPGEFLSRIRRTDAARGARVAREVCAGPHATIRVGGGTWGLPCPPELAQEVASADVLTALEAGRLMEAIAAIGEGDVTAAVRQALDAAARPNIRMERVTTFRGAPGPATAHVALRFDGDDLIVRGAVAERYGPGAEGLPADAVAAPITDPSGRTFVQGVVQTCAALEVTLLPVEELGPGVGFAAGRRVPVRTGAVENCPTDPITTPWRVLGWAPQGLLLAHPAPTARLVVPLTADGEPAGDPVPLADDAPSPAPLRGARTTPNGDVWILETRHGVLRTTPSGTELWRPQGWPATEPLAAALSDDGARVAVLLGNEVFLLRSDSAGTD